MQEEISSAKGREVIENPIDYARRIQLQQRGAITDKRVVGEFEGNTWPILGFWYDLLIVKFAMSASTASHKPFTLDHTLRGNGDLFVDLVRRRFAASLHKMIRFENKSRLTDEELFGKKQLGEMRFTFALCPQFVL